MMDLIKSVSGKKLLYVMAAEQEYGPELKQRFRPLITGVGPVEAAVGLTAALQELTMADQKPHLVISLGSAGSAQLEQTGIYQVSSVSYRDMDASPLGFEKGATPFLDLPVIVDLPITVPGIAAATLSTGANIISGDVYDTIDAQMVDMESFAVLRACNRFAVPLLGLRGISDGKAELGHIDDWTQYLHIVDEKLAAAVDRLEQAIADDTIAL
ncbi:5'-methylthioadenosine/S-adenosylhomocysteine nucleosidase [Hoeflea prorocentri]|uniref:5'-methylthioadenosine/S-adenosylhomocysteine nucleosidase n=1 Tax=Hoeflea prorocentri TaxID=1922333 RepID=A0A9X3UJX1_9HYPH|nr:5'-methylthioadenosine/S-adenosylhomocysteine nucleosidase [Hoeflea prorocentri]MCY6381926.1 5'-methylthioadenosine/S-adenosylhomocysteine nucleosidase [Hoeflea prorocentri]MDA5399726.1 5'-methylthioadenosine/S-adenosylhomocysteine nucleosidase [Hoeflea prorocentri]